MFNVGGHQRRGKSVTVGLTRRHDSLRECYVWSWSPYGFITGETLLIGKAGARWSPRQVCYRSRGRGGWLTYATSRRYETRRLAKTSPMFGMLVNNNSCRHVREDKTMATSVVGEVIGYWLFIHRHTHAHYVIVSRQHRMPYAGCYRSGCHIVRSGYITLVWRQRQ